MSTNFPTSIDVLTNPVAADPLDSATVPHAAQHANINDAVEAIETQIGTTAVPVLARLAGPQFTGVPTAPTAAPLTNTTQIATTAYVVAAANTGPQGSQGSQGATGAQGSQGATGAQGATGSVASFGFTSGLYYRGLSQQANTTAVLNQTFYVALAINKTNTFDRISIETLSTYVGTGAVRLGIYNNDSTTGKPSTVVLDAGTVATTAASTIYQITISQSLSVGNYWIAFNAQTLASTPAYRGITATPASGFGYVTSSTGAILSDAGSWIESSISGAFTTAGTLTAILTASTAMLRST